jgi:hypothetical protein
MHGDGFNAQGAAGAKNPQSDFTAIGNDDFFQHGKGLR